MEFKICLRSIVWLFVTLHQQDYVSIFIVCIYTYRYSKYDTNFIKINTSYRLDSCAAIPPAHSLAASVWQDLGCPPGHISPWISEARPSEGGEGWCHRQGRREVELIRPLPLIQWCWKKGINLFIPRLFMFNRPNSARHPCQHTFETFPSPTAEHPLGGL